MGRRTAALHEEQEEKNRRTRDMLSANSRNAIAKKREVANLNVSALVTCYSQYFVNDIKNYKVKTKSGDKDRQLQDLVYYAFHKFTAPKFLLKEWSVNVKDDLSGNARLHLVGQNASIDFRKWYICIATGGSLYKEHAKYFLTKRETHIFTNCKHNLTAKEVITFAVAKAAGASDSEALRISKTKLTDQRISEYSFWKECICWFANHPGMTVSEIDDTIDFIKAKRNDNIKFSLMGSGLTVNSLKRKVLDWHYDLRRMKLIGEASWSGFELPNACYKARDANGNDIYWHFTQILTAKDLQAEGNAMHHCVFSYKKNCVAGVCSIWSVRTCFSPVLNYNDSSRKLTIELRKDGTIAQVRGFANRSVKPAEENIVARWAKEFDLHHYKHVYF